MALVTAEARDTAPTWTIYARFPAASEHTRAHSDIVRCIDWDSQANRLFSGGEDGCICAWNMDPQEASAPANPSLSSFALYDTGAAAQPSRATQRRSAASHKHRYNPYR